MTFGRYIEKLEAVKAELKKGIIGQEYVIDSVLKALICSGHVLLESVPGLAKTLMARILSLTIKGAEFQRIQFTPDLLPSDITGVTIYERAGSMQTIKGPVFTNILLADEINRTPPKVQSALLQAMQERQVTIGRSTFNLPKPFFVIATQNPLEQQGVYQLSHAQVDRFLFKILLDYPSPEEEQHIIENNIDVKEIEEFRIKRIFDLKEIPAFFGKVKNIHISEEAKNYILNIVEATRKPSDYGLEYGKYIHFGASSRASIFLALAARATAFMDDRDYTIPEDIRCMVLDVLRHRIVPTYEAKALGIKTDSIIDEILKKVPVE